MFSGYTFKKLKGPKNNSQLCKYSFIITMDPGGRMENIKTQLKKYWPSEYVILVLNKGFRKSNKPKSITQSNHDLFFTNIIIFKYVIEVLKLKNENIYIFEDDFNWDMTDLDDHLNEIQQFINKEQSNFDCYNLGAMASIPEPFPENGWKHLNTFISGSTHALIHTWNNIQNLYKRFDLKHFDETYNQLSESRKHVDEFFSVETKMVVYYKPINIQLIEMTENVKTWKFSEAKTSIMKSFGLHKPNNYKNFNLLNKIVLVFFIIVYIVIIFLVELFIYKKI